MRAQPSDSCEAVKSSKARCHPIEGYISCVRYLLILFTLAAPASAAVLKSGEYSVTQSWSQEQNYQRPYLVKVPEAAKGRKLPVFIFLHGNGGNARGAMNGFTRRNRTLSSRYIMVFAEGYAKSWNIVSERSKADDRGFIDAIVKQLAAFDNVQSDNFTIMGSSNGAALANQMMIESRLPNIRNYICGVSPLNVFQHDGKNFKAKGDDNKYRKSVTPMKGRRLLNISGTEDRLVPYRGGLSRAIPAKGGKLAFVDAEESIYLWAKAMGYQGPKLAKPTRKNGRLDIFNYLDGDVIHYKVNREGHGATGAVGEKVLIEFLEN